MGQLSTEQQAQYRIEQAPIYVVTLGDPKNNCMGAGICHIDEFNPNVFGPRKYNEVLAHLRNENGQLELGFLKRSIPKKYQEMLFGGNFLVNSTFKKHKIGVGTIWVKPATYTVTNNDQLYYVHFG